MQEKQGKLIKQIFYLTYAISRSCAERYIRIRMSSGCIFREESIGIETLGIWKYFRISV